MTTVQKNIRADKFTQWLAFAQRGCGVRSIEVAILQPKGPQFFVSMKTASWGVWTDCTRTETSGSAMHNSMDNPVGAKNQKNVLCFNGAVRSTIEWIREGRPLSDKA